MESWATAAGGVGLALLAVVGWIVVDIVGQAMAESSKDAVFRRPGFRERRQRARGWLSAGWICTMLGVMSLLFATAALTSGHEGDRDTGRLFLIAAAVLAAIGVGLLRIWWLKAGQPRHY